MNAVGGQWHPYAPTVELTTVLVTAAPPAAVVIGQVWLKLAFLEVGVAVTEDRIALDHGIVERRPRCSEIRRVEISR